jgi:hypothetical protein
MKFYNSLLAIAVLAVGAASEMDRNTAIIQSVEFALTWVADEESIQDLLRRALDSELLDNESNLLQLVH